MIDDSLAATIKNLCAEFMPSLSVKEIEALTPDASTRTYFRLWIESTGNSECSDENSGHASSLVAMYYETLISPEYEGVASVPADEAYVSLTRFLRGHGIAVPELLVDAREKGVLLLEDVGDRLLAPMLLRAVNSAENENSSGEEALARDAYRQAVDVILALQRIPLTGESIAENRHFSEAAFLNEMREFFDYIFTPTLSLLPQLDFEVLSKSFLESVSALARRISTFEKTLAHRDFHGWNLLLDATDRLRIIDFQDALMAPRPYDLVGLINDRDVDTLLGKEQYVELLHQFAEGSSSVSGPAREKFLLEFSLVALQRDLKVAGRFAKLQQRGLERYAKWIPGTMKRIGRCLQGLSAHPEAATYCEVQELCSLLPGHFDEIAAGFKEGSWY